MPSWSGSGGVMAGAAGGAARPSGALAAKPPARLSDTAGDAGRWTRWRGSGRTGEAGPDRPSRGGSGGGSGASGTTRGGGGLIGVPCGRVGVPAAGVPGGGTRHGPLARPHTGLPAVVRPVGSGVPVAGVVFGSGDGRGGCGCRGDCAGRAGCPEDGGLACCRSGAAPG